jgi:glutaredoxin
MKQKRVVKDVATIVVTAAFAIALGSQLPKLIALWRGPYKTGDYNAHVANLPYKLTLYGTTTCPHCASARAYLKQAGIAFNDQLIDQSKVAAAAYAKLNEAYVPVLVSKHELIVGFKEREYANLSRLVNEE